MTAAWMWARSELRTRWKAWILLGLLAGATVGLTAAGLAGARRTAKAVPDFVTAAHTPTAAALVNDPAFRAPQVAEVTALPEVTHTYPFIVPVALEVFRPTGIDGNLVPVTPAATRGLAGVLVEGRVPDPHRVGEVVVDEHLRDRHHLDLGATMVVGQSSRGIAQIPPELAPPGGMRPFRQRVTVVGIAKSTSSDESWVPSSAFYDKYGDHLAGLENLFADLRRGQVAVPRFARDVARIAGHAVNVESSNDLFGIRKATNVTGFEEDGLLLFALAALLGGGVLVGQALVRAISGSAADLPTWRAIGADRRLAMQALVLPAVATAIVAAVTAFLVAVVLSDRFPVGIARDFDLDVGYHVDWLVLGLAMLGTVVAVLAIAIAAAWWRVTRRSTVDATPSRMDRLVAPMSRAPALMIGARLAGEPGRGRRAVPVRSAMVGAIAGVLGVVGCLTFRAGIQDAINQPRRSGVVWDFALASGDGAVPPATIRAVAGDPDISGAVRATWHRAVPVNGHSVPVFATRPVTGDIQFVMLNGRRPRAADELALAPTTMRELHVAVGDHVSIGQSSSRSAVVVGEALLPVTSHTDYDQSGWMTAPGLARAVELQRSTDAEDYLLVRFRDGVDTAAAQRTVTRLGDPSLYALPATLPTAVADLGRIEDLPVALAAFFGVLACATVAHALVTTVRRRRHDLAVLRSIGFTRRQTRLAIAWQATLLASIGVVIGVPLGIATGRFAWRWLADDYPLAYVPPLAWLAIAVVVTTAIFLTNVLAAGPAHVAARIRPAETLRTE